MWEEGTGKGEREQAKEGVKEARREWFSLRNKLKKGGKKNK